MMILRPAVLADAAAIVAVDRESRMTAMPSIVWPRSAAEILGYVGQVLIPSGGVVVAEEERAVVGYIALKAGWVLQLYLRPDCWRRGIGSALMAEAKGRFPEGLELYCFQVNARGRAFYEKHGFEVVALGDGSGNEEGAPDILYRWVGVGGGAVVGFVGRRRGCGVGTEKRGLPRSARNDGGGMGDLRESCAVTAAQTAHVLSMLLCEWVPRVG